MGYLATFMPIPAFLQRTRCQDGTNDERIGELVDPPGERVFQLNWGPSYQNRRDDWWFFNHLRESFCSILHHHLPSPYSQTTCMGLSAGIEFGQIGLQIFPVW